MILNLFPLKKLCNLLHQTYLLADWSIKKYNLCSEFRKRSAVVIGFDSPWAAAEASPMALTTSVTFDIAFLKNNIKMNLLTLFSKLNTDIF